MRKERVRKFQTMIHARVHVLYCWHKWLGNLRSSTHSHTHTADQHATALISVLTVLANPKDVPSLLQA